MGKHFNADRAYFLPFSQGGTFLSRTFEYRLKGVSSQKHNRDSMDLSCFVQYIHFFSQDGISRSDDITTLPPDLSAAFKAQDTPSYLHSAAYAGTTLTGILGLDSALLPRVWQEEEIATLAYLSRVLALYLFPPAGDENKL